MFCYSQTASLLTDVRCRDMAELLWGLFVYYPPDGSRDLCTIRLSSWCFSTISCLPANSETSQKLVCANITTEQESGTERLHCNNISLFLFMVVGDAAAVIEGNWLSVVCGRTRLNHLIGIWEDKLHCRPARLLCGDNCCSPFPSAFKCSCETVCVWGINLHNPSLDFTLLYTWITSLLWLRLSTQLRLYLGRGCFLKRSHCFLLPFTVRQ